MVGIAKAHHPSNCLPLNNRNHFDVDDDGNVAAKEKKFTTHSTDDDGIIDSIVGGDENGQSNCEHWQRRQRSRRCIINDNTVQPNNSRSRRHHHHRRRCRGIDGGVNVRIYHGNGNRKKTHQDAGLWFRIRTTMVSSNLSVSVVFCAAISLLLLNIDVITAEPQQTIEQQCEPKVLEETPPDPVSIRIDGNLLFLVSNKFHEAIRFQLFFVFFVRFAVFIYTMDLTFLFHTNFFLLFASSLLINFTVTFRSFAL